MDWRPFHGGQLRYDKQLLHRASGFFSCDICSIRFDSFVHAPAATADRNAIGKNLMGFGLDLPEECKEVIGRVFTENEKTKDEYYLVFNNDGTVRWIFPL